MDEIETVFSVSDDPLDAAVVRVDGELDLATGPELLCALEKRSGDLALDCSGLTFIDAAGLSAVLAVHAGCRSRGRRFVMLNPSRAVVRLLEVVDLDTVLPVCNTNGAAP